ncbi:MAG TPA: serine/threonine-protein kinase [Myxococcaceae bacterium]|nr:serine/threonine-protein kinase [Myxococcaceae bacterium]
MELTDSIVDRLRHVAALPDLVGTRYELESQIGRGGTGVVYAARDRELNRPVALKVFDFALPGEAQLIAQLEHPAIVPIYESGTLADGRSFYAMKRVVGEPLDRYVTKSPSLAERLRVIRRVGEALAFAHSRGVIHRDLKPQNVMVGNFGQVYVMDWGVDAVAGTPAFRAPEAELDQRSDIYALGLLLQFMLPQAPPHALRAVANKATRPDPADRYWSVYQFLADIERFQEGLAVEAWSEPLWHRVRRFGSRNAVLLWLFAAYASVKFLLFFLRSV